MITLDPDELLTAASAFERSGMLLLAAGAAAQAASELRIRNDLPRSVSASALVVTLIRRARPLPVEPVPDSDRLPITPRERDVATLVAAGLSNRHIAERLHLSVRTVESHIYRACTRLGIPDRAALAAVVVTDVPHLDLAAGVGA